MQETLPVVPWVALRGENDSHVVVSSVADQSLHVANHSDILSLLQYGQHRQEPITLDEDVVVEKAKEFTSSFSSAEVVVYGKTFALLVEKHPMGCIEAFKVLHNPITTSIINDDNLVGQLAR
jgi:hypothetical protein